MSIFHNVSRIFSKHFAHPTFSRPTLVLEIPFGQTIGRYRLHSHNILCFGLLTNQSPITGQFLFVHRVQLSQLGLLNQLDLMPMLFILIVGFDVFQGLIRTNITYLLDFCFVFGFKEIHWLWYFQVQRHGFVLLIDLFQNVVSFDLSQDFSRILYDLRHLWLFLLDRRRRSHFNDKLKYYISQIPKFTYQFMNSTKIRIHQIPFSITQPYQKTKNIQLNYLE